MTYLMISGVKLNIPKEIKDPEAAINLFSKYISGIKEMNYKVDNGNVVMKERDRLSGAHIQETFEDGGMLVRIYPVTKEKIFFLHGTNEVEKSLVGDIPVGSHIQSFFDNNKDFDRNKYSVSFDKNAVIVKVQL